MRGIEANLLVGLKTLWDASSLPASVPGGLHHGPVPMTKPDGTALVSPYARVEVEPQDPEPNSSAYYLQTFRVALTVWSQTGSVAAGTIQRALGRVFDPPASGAAPSGLAVADAAVIWVKPARGRFETDPDRKDARDVILAEAAWDVTLWTRKQ